MTKVIRDPLTRPTRLTRLTPLTMTDSILEWAEQSFIVGKIKKAYWLAEMAKTVDPFFGNVDKYVTAYAVHVTMLRKTPTGEIKYYGLLGVLDPSANIHEINDGFHNISPLVNEDKNCSAAAKEAHRQVTIAWKILSYPSKRREYDVREGFQPREEEITRPPCQCACRTIYC